MSDEYNIINNRYTNLQEIGKGGMGTVYSAHDEQLERDVAIKLILPEFAQQDDFRKRFEREAKLQAKMSHASIIPIYDFESSKEGLYYVMRLIKGKTLRSIIDKKKLKPEMIINVVNSLLSALGYAHERGLIHRDLKPDNIFIDDTGQVFLGDFGIARLAEDENDMATTKQWIFLGTLAYSSPEQINGEELKPASDIYSLGVIFYEMVVRELPFSGNLNNIIAGHLTQTVKSLATFKIDDKLEYLLPAIEKMLAKKVGERYGSCEEMKEELERANSQMANLGIEEFLTDDESEEMDSLMENATPSILVINEDDSELIKGLKTKKIKLNEVHNLVVQLEKTRKQIERKTYLQLEERYNDKIINLQHEIEKLILVARTRITEVDLQLGAIKINLLAYAHQLEESKRDSKDEDALKYQKDLQQKIDEAEAEKKHYEIELASLKNGMNQGGVVKRKRKRITVISVAVILISFFYLYALGTIIYDSFHIIPGKVFESSLQIREQHKVGSLVVGSVKKDEKLIIYDEYRGSSRKEGVIIKKTLLSTSGKYTILNVGSVVKIDKIRERDYLVFYQKDSKSKVVKGGVDKDAVAKNIWFLVETESGSVGWALSKNIRKRWKTSIMRRLLLSSRRFFIFKFGNNQKLKKSDSKVAVVEGEILGDIQNKESLSVKRGSAYNRRKITFNYYLDMSGATALDLALNREIIYAKKVNNNEKVKILLKIRESFFQDAFKNAHIIIQNVAIAGPFNGWNPEKDSLVVSKTNGYYVYSGEKDFKFSKDEQEYAYVFKLQIKNVKEPQYLWVADPLSTNTQPDGFAGKRAFFKIPKIRNSRRRKFLPNEIKTSSEAVNFGALNLVDGKSDTAWRSATESSGLGEWLLCKFPYRRGIHQMGIVNGNAKDGFFTGNNRVEKIKLVFDDGEEVIYLRDFVAGFQMFNFEKVHYSSKVRIIIKSVYPGLDSSTVSISELIFY